MFDYVGWRKKHGWSQLDVAAAAGVDQTAVNRVEKGRTKTFRRLDLYIVATSNSPIDTLRDVLGDDNFEDPREEV